MASAYVKEVLHATEDTIANGDSSADFGVGLATASAPGAGNTVVVFWSGRISIAALAPTVTDSKGNTYSAVWKANGSTVSLIAVTDQAAGKLTTADTITVHSGNAQVWTAYTVQVEEFSGPANPLVVDVSTTGSGNSASASTGTTAATAQADELALAMCAAQGNRTIAKDAAYTAPTTGSQAVTTGTAVSGFGTYKILAATGTQTATYTFTSAIWAACLVTIKSASVPSVAPSGIASGEAFGVAALRRILSPSGVASGEALGTPRIARILAAVGIGTGQTFGVASLLRLLNPTGITSSVAFGLSSLRRLLAPSGVTTGQAFGSTKIVRALAQQGIAPGAVGTPSAVRLMRPTAIAPAESFGTPQVQGYWAPVDSSALVSDRTLATAAVGDALLRAVIVSDTLADSVVVSEG